MSAGVTLWLDGRLVARDAGAASLGASLLALRAGYERELELNRVDGPGAEGLLLERLSSGMLRVTLIDELCDTRRALDVAWHRAVEAAAEFLSGRPAWAGGLLAELRESFTEEETVS